MLKYLYAYFMEHKNTTTSTYNAHKKKNSALLAKFCEANNWCF